MYFITLHLIYITICTGGRGQYALGVYEQFIPIVPLNHHR